MENFQAFQAFTVLIAVISCICMMYTGMHSESRFDNKISEADAQASADQTARQTACSFAMLKSLTWQILTNRDFQLFVTMNFFQVFMLAFFNNFTMIFTEHLIPPDALPSLAKSFMYGAGFILPQLLVLSSQSLLQSLGYYKIILFTFIFEAGLAVVMLALGPQRYYFLAFFLTVPRICSPLSSMVFGTNALFTKPAQSLAPMIVLNVLNHFGYEGLKDVTQGSNKSALESLHSVMFYLVCLVPMCVAALQVLAWRPFSIRNSHTVDPKYIDT
ncbi:uncharacterized protein LOC118566324 [Fundulus heteroclitus]|uniref:uncharacterized protein LOC118566324 n=1 Tax=Fundulus heteroclitus TaxID=8078 RepID=UPI00165AD44B|nr:uncharacterized protein LOC118566324 [Fundulus heteroclitus]